MKGNELMQNLTKTFHRTGLQLKKHSPEILIVAGVIGVVTSAVMACKATTKVGPIKEEARKKIETIKQQAEEDPKADEKEVSKALAVTYAHTGLEFVKLYAPSVILGGLSIGSILASNNIMRKRNVALAAAYTAVDSSFRGYRGRVIERFGEKLDRELKYNIKTEEVEEVEVDENGKEKVVKKQIEVVDGDPTSVYSPYARFYDDGCNGWQKDSEFNLMYLRTVQSHANDILHSEGHLFLNDVYEMLGIPKTAVGQVIGWVSDNPKGDGYVDFGIYDANKPQNRDFVNGYERVIILDFNVDGNILDLI